MNTTNEKINNELKYHQIRANDWRHKALIEDLHIWSERFIFEFKLECSTPAIKIEWLRSNCYGHFHADRNGFGLTNEIAINQKYLEDRECWETLGTLFHELMHAEQQALGTESKGNYHNNDFVNRAKKFGLIVDRRGCQQYMPRPTKFFTLLEKYGIKFSEIQTTISDENDPLIVKPSKSKLILWECYCSPKPYKVRVARRGFQAKCLKCGHKFINRNK